MIYNGRVVKANKYKIGTKVRVTTVKGYEGKISHMDYRFDGHVGWHYKITFPWAQLTFAEKSLRKVNK